MFVCLFVCVCVCGEREREGNCWKVNFYNNLLERHGVLSNYNNSNARNATKCPI